VITLQWGNWLKSIVDPSLAFVMANRNEPVLFARSPLLSSLHVFTVQIVGGRPASAELETAAAIASDA